MHSLVVPHVHSCTNDMSLSSQFQNFLESPGGSAYIEGQMSTSPEINSYFEGTMVQMPDSHEATHTHMLMWKVPILHRVGDVHYIYTTNTMRPTHNLSTASLCTPL